MSFFKYYRERADADGEKLWWPGGPDGFPFRGSQPPQTTGDQYDGLKLTGKARVRLFYLSKPEDYRDYIQVRDKCANGLYAQLDRDRVWDEDTKNYRIWLEWVELGYDTPPTEVIQNAFTPIQAENSNVQLLPYGRLAGVQQAGW